MKRDRKLLSKQADVSHMLVCGEVAIMFKWPQVFLQQLVAIKKLDQISSSLRNLLKSGRKCPKIVLEN